MRALVIDDDVYCLNIASEYFKFKGFEVTALDRPSCQGFKRVDDGCEVMQPDYDIIVSDNRMPGMTGIDFFEFLDDVGCPIPVQRRALLTGDLTQEEFERASRRGVKVFNKPCSLGDLDLWLEEVLPECNS